MAAFRAGSGHAAARFPVLPHSLGQAARRLNWPFGQVEQNLAATLTRAQRVYIINNGHIVHEGAADEIKAQPHLLQRYLGL